MSRFHYLHQAIQEIKKARAPGMLVGGKWKRAKILGTNVELAKFCGIRTNRSMEWFWDPKPKVIPKAEVTMAALLWVCKKRGAEHFLIPSWETLHFFLFYLLYGNDHSLDLLSQKLKIPYRGGTINFHHLGERATAEGQAKRYGVDVETIKQYAKPRWKAGRRSDKDEKRQPNGEFALRFLADMVLPGRLQCYMDFLGTDELQEYPYHDLPGHLIPKVKAEHETLRNDANELWEYYKGAPGDLKRLHERYVKEMPEWLRKTVL